MQRHFASQLLSRLAIAGAAGACGAAGAWQVHGMMGARGDAAARQPASVHAAPDQRVVGIRVMTVEVPAQPSLTSSQGVISLDIPGAPPNEFVPFIAADRDPLLESVVTAGNGYTHASQRLVVEMGQRAGTVVQRDGATIALEVQVQPAAPGLVEAWVRYAEGDRWVLPFTWIQFAEGQAFVIKVHAQDASVGERSLIITIDRPGHEPQSGC